MNSDACTKRNSKCIINQIRKSSDKEEAPSVAAFFNEALAYIASNDTPDASTLIAYDIINTLIRSPVSGYYSRIVGERLCEPCVIPNAKGDKPCPEVGVFLDLAGFKGINDFLVYQAGDAVLKAFADWLAYNISAQQRNLCWLPIHYGGDEFALVGFGKTRSCDEDYQKTNVDLDNVRKVLKEMRSNDLKSRNILMRMPFGTKSKESVTCYIPERGNCIAREEGKGAAFTQEENGYIRYVFTGLEYKFSAEYTLNDAISSLGVAKTKDYNEDVINIPRGMIGLNFFWGGTDELDAHVDKMLADKASETEGFISLLKNMVFVANVPDLDSEARKACEDCLADYIHIKISDEGKVGNKENAASADTPPLFSPGVTSCYRDGAVLFRVDFAGAPEKSSCLEELSDATKRLKLEEAIVTAMNSKCKMLLSRCTSISLEIK